MKPDTRQRLKDAADIFKRVLDVCPELVFIGNPVLRSKTEEVSLEEGVVIANRLIEVLQKYRALTGVGRGLAAPQIGESKSVFVTFYENEFQVYLNPRILKKSDKENLYIESCLSCGIISADVKRPESITLEYMNEKAEYRAATTDGFLARLLQHEFDHLEGIINIDRAEKNSLHFMTDDPLKQSLRKVEK